MINNKQVTQKRIGIVATLLIMLLCVAFVAFYITVQQNLEQAVTHPFGMSSYQITGDYAIDPETMLLSLEQGEMNVFYPISPTPETEDAANVPLPYGLYPWSQVEYLKVASALHQYVWKEDLKDWHLYSMYFFRGCQDNLVGFDAGGITYFKSLDGLFHYTTRVLDIYPVTKGVSWGGNANFPRPLFGWENIDLWKLKITADDALQIAEEKGGSQFRLKVKNACTVDVFINPNPNQEVDWKWHVFYDTYSFGTLSIQVDTDTGEAEVVESSQ